MLVTNSAFSTLFFVYTGTLKYVIRLYSRLLKIQCGNYLSKRKSLYFHSAPYSHLLSQRL